MHLKPQAFLLALALSSFSFAPATKADPGHKHRRVAPPTVQLALLLDTSNSMDGLIHQAKTELWSIVNEIGSATLGGQDATIEVALYEYGKASLSAESGYLRMVAPLTTDLDLISEKLYSLSTNGGEEYAGQVIAHASNHLEWTSQTNAYRAIFIAGNEPFDQGPIHFSGAIGGAREQNIVVNTIHCGDERAAFDGGWHKGARLGAGSLLTINHNAQKLDIQTPYDDDIYKLNQELNDTYIGYGTRGRSGAARQKSQDAGVKKAKRSASLERAKTKAGKHYKNSSWDLVDKMEEDAEVLGSLPAESLPQPMRRMNNKERKKFVAEKAKRRKKIQAKLLKMSEKRESYIKKKQKSDTESRLDNELPSKVKSQMKKLNFKF